jgi:tetratricopeptide (TPR) repeat protein
MDLLARASEELGRFSEAADYHLKRYAMLPPGELQRTATRKAAVAALRKAGRYADALGHLRELVREDGGDNQLLFDLARTEEAAGQLPQAKVDLERLLERIPAGDTAFRQDVDTVLQRVLRALQGKPPPELVPAEEPVGTPGAGTGAGAGPGGRRDGSEPLPAGPDAGGGPPGEGASGGQEPVSPAIRTARSA